MRKKRILVADDDSAILEVVGFLLEDGGYEVELLPNGYNLENREDNLPELIFLDIRMSGISGVDICKKLKSKESTKRIPVILFSANKDIQELALECHADDILEKPFEMDDLYKIADKYLN